MNDETFERIMRKYFQQWKSDKEWESFWTYIKSRSILQSFREVLEIYEKELQEEKDKMRAEIQEFAEAMEKEMQRHDPEKGDSWKSMPIKDLEEILDGVIEDYRYAGDYWEGMEELIDVANIAMMLWHRCKEEVEKNE